jgi:hypothetical protein
MRGQGGIDVRSMGVLLGLPAQGTDDRVGFVVRHACKQVLPVKRMRW